MSFELVHATAVARRSGVGWRGVLIRGRSGAGKSDLGLRLMSTGWGLVGDDYVRVWRSGGGLYAAAAPNLPHAIEVRGVGLVATGRAPLTRAVLVIDCMEAESERLPEPTSVRLAGVDVPRFALNAAHASAPAKVAAALSLLEGGADWPKEAPPVGPGLPDATGKTPGGV